MLNRRALFGFMTAALALAAGSVAVADRYHNQSGLASGRFVWSPSIAPHGALAIVVSPAERTLHVYRDGVEIGISTITTPADANSATGVFVLSQIDDAESRASSSDEIWRGTELFLGGASHVPSDGIRARLPSDFAELLREATHPGAAVIVARERSEPQLVSAPGPFVDPVETGSLNRVGRFARPELRIETPQSETATSPTPQPSGDASGARNPDANSGVRGQITSLILSRADLSAYVLKDGVIVDRLPIAVEDPTKPLGLHAAVLVTPGNDRQEAKWLAFGIDDDPEAAHVVGNEAEHALRRVRFMDKGRSKALARALKAGTVVVLMDGHGPSVTEVPRFNVALLQNENASPEPPPAAQAGPLPPEITKGDAAAAARARAQESTQSTPASRPPMAKRKTRSVEARQRGGAATKRRRGPLDQREEWPASIYWPY